MHAHRRTVDHLHIAVVGLDDGIHQPIPDAGLAPTIEAVVRSRVGPVSLRHIPPGRAGAQHPEDAVQDATVFLWLAASPTRRQVLLDHAPLEVGKIVAHGPGSNVWQLESLFAPIR